MGHYDEFYAQDDYKEIDPRQKQKTFEEIRFDLNSKGYVCGTYDCWYGYAMREFANTYPDECYIESKILPNNRVVWGNDVKLIKKES